MMRKSIVNRVSKSGSGYRKFGLCFRFHMSGLNSNSKSGSGLFCKTWSGSAIPSWCRY